MMSLFAALSPVMTVLKPFWKYVAIGVAVVAFAAYAHHRYSSAMDAAYKRGVADTQAADAAVVAKQEQRNAEIQKELAISAAAKQAELEGKIHESELVASDLRTQLRVSRVCTDERSGRAAPDNPGPAREVNGAASNAGPVGTASENAPASETVGDDLILIGQSCQETTDKLFTLQSYVNELLGKFRPSAGKTGQ